MIHRVELQEIPVGERPGAVLLALQKQKVGFFQHGGIPDESIAPFNPLLVSGEAFAGGMVPIGVLNRCQAFCGSSGEGIGHVSQVTAGKELQHHPEGIPRCAAAIIPGDGEGGSHQKGIIIFNLPLGCFFQNALSGGGVDAVNVVFSHVLRACAAALTDAAEVDDFRAARNLPAERQKLRAVDLFFKCSDFHGSLL